MNATQGLKVLTDLINELNLIKARIEQGNASAMPIELALMSQRAIDLYNEIKKFEQRLQGTAPVVTVPQPQPAPVIPQAPVPPSPPQPAYPPAPPRVETPAPERKPAPEQLERKREKLQRMEEMETPAAAASPQQSEPAPAKKSQISDIYAQAREKASMSGSKSINEKLRSPEPKASLNEKFAGTQVKKNLVDKLKLSPIGNLSTAMSVNQKALFTQNLFRGDDKEFKRVVGFVNGSSNFSEAKFYLQSEIAPKNGWRDDDPLVQEFLELVYRKFL